MKLCKDNNEYSEKGDMWNLIFRTNKSYFAPFRGKSERWKLFIDDFFAAVMIDQHWQNTMGTGQL